MPILWLRVANVIAEGSRVLFVTVCYTIHYHQAGPNQLDLETLYCVTTKPLSLSQPLKDKGNKLCLWTIWYQAMSVKPGPYLLIAQHLFGSTGRLFNTSILNASILNTSNTYFALWEGCSQRWGRRRQKGAGGQLLPPEPHVQGSALAAGDHKPSTFRRWW